MVGKILRRVLVEEEQAKLQHQEGPADEAAVTKEIK